MDLVAVLLAVVAVGVVGAVAAGRVGGGLAPAAGSTPHLPLPAAEPGRLPASAVDEVRFSLAFRGYRMDEVDAALDRLREELRLRDVEIARLSVEDA